MLWEPRTAESPGPVVYCPQISKGSHSELHEAEEAERAGSPGATGKPGVARDPQQTMRMCERPARVQCSDFDLAGLLLPGRTPP